MKVLIAIDGSESSSEAIQFIAGLLRPETDTMALCYVSPAVDLSVPVEAIIVQQGEEALSKAILAEALQHVPDSVKANVQLLTGSGDVAGGILASAEQWQADLIVVGARGLGAVGRMFLGSVSRRVVRTAKTPVLIVRNAGKIAPSKGVNVLVACENAENGRRLIKMLPDFAWPKASRCAVMTVVPSVLGGSIPKWLAAPARSAEVEDLIGVWLEENKRQVSSARSEMQAVLSLLSNIFQKTSAIVAEGNAASEIIDAAQQQPTDLIVVGAKPATPAGRLFIGSTFEAVLNHAPCSVLVVHHS